MSNLTIALLASLAYFVSYGGNWLLGQCMIERPIVVGTITGLLLGDVTKGVIIGGALEAIYMGAVNIGGATSAEPVSATVMSVTFAIVSGLDTAEAITLAVPIGLIFNSIMIVFLMSSNLFATWYQHVVNKGDTKGMTPLILSAWLWQYLSRTVIIFFCVYLGSAAVQAFMSNLPTNVVHGLSVAAGMMGAVGMAVLMRMLANNSNMIFLFVGFLLSKYLGLPAIVVAIFALAIALVIGTTDKKILDVESLAKTGGAIAPINEKEDFLK